ncbi:MAG: hypothetical protein KKE20_04100 [Nanoarchaeota archaeon]|nr:hypothetical protein [Nanoarchaeota archaeon]
MKSKKGVEMTLNTIIIAAIALIAMIILILFLTGNMGRARQNINKTSVTYGDNCEIPGSGRDCKTPEECRNVGGVNYGTNFPDCKGMVCCSD